MIEQSPDPLDLAIEELINATDDMLFNTAFVTGALAMGFTIEQATQMACAKIDRINARRIQWAAPSFN